MSTALQPQDVVGLGVKWLQVWDLDPLGECCCLAGSARWNGVGNVGRCHRPGKHPWWVERDGEPEGFKHGALAAVELSAAMRYSRAGNRLAAVPGDRVIVLDLDGDKAFRTFVRMSRRMTVESFVGACRTPRGFHVWLRCVTDGWSQSAALTWMRNWLGKDMKGLDLRTGDRSYVVWPAGGDRRRWMPVEEFREVVERAYVPGWDLETSGWGPVWLAEGVGARVVQNKAALTGEIEIPKDIEPGLAGQVLAWERLELGLAGLRGMAPESGRNNRLNLLAYYQGSICVAVGTAREKVVDTLVAGGRDAGTHGVVGTTRSGLRAGVDKAVQAGERRIRMQGLLAAVVDAAP